VPLIRNTTADLGTQHFNSEYIERLTADVLRTHINDAFQSEACAYSGGSNTVLACAGFSDDTLLTEPFG
jgi:hypothetical protein